MPRSRSLVSRAVALATAAVASASAVAGEYRYTVTNLAPLGFYTVAALNNHGHVVGTSVDGHLLFWDGVRVLDLGTGGGVSAVPTDLNNAGQIAGYALMALSASEYPTRAFIHSRGKFQDLVPLLSGENSAALAINDAGVVVGSYSDNAAPHFFRYGSTFSATEFRGFPVPTTHGSLTPVAINSSAQIAGTLADSFGDFSERWQQYGFVWDAGYHLIGNFETQSTPRMGQQPSSDAQDMNDAGTVIGTATSDVGGLHKSIFLLSQGRMAEIDPGVSAAGWYGSGRLRLNNAGVAVGMVRFGAEDAVVGQPALISGGVVLKLDELIDRSSGLPAWNPVDINDRGQILTATLTLLTPVRQQGRLVNVSARSVAGAGDQTSILGFVLGGGSGEGSVLTRVVGPSLQPFGVSSAASNPSLRVFGASASLVGTNDDWNNASSASELVDASRRVGAFVLPDGSKDAALLLHPSKGAYTVHVSAEDPSRVVLTELYDAGDRSAAPLVNASVRLQVGTGEAIGIMGFVVAGDGPCTLLIRAAGPALVAKGLAGALPDPQLWLYRKDRLVMGNNNWGSAATNPWLAQKTAEAGAFAFADGSKDAALLVQVEPGVYTVHVADTANANGVALIELYLID